MDSAGNGAGKTERGGMADLQDVPRRRAPGREGKDQITVHRRMGRKGGAADTVLRRRGGPFDHAAPAFARFGRRTEPFWTGLWCSGFPARTRRPEKIWPKYSATGAGRSFALWKRNWRALKACAGP